MGIRLDSVSVDSGWLCCRCSVVVRVWASDWTVCQWTVVDCVVGVP